MKTKILLVLLLCFGIVTSEMFGYSKDSNFLENNRNSVKNYTSENSGQSSALAITENKGQIWDEDGKSAKFVKYYLNAGELQVFLLETGLAYQFTKVHYPEGYQDLISSKNPEDLERVDKLSAEIRTETFRMNMTLLDANPNASISSEGRSKDFINFYNRDALDVHHFQKVTYHEIYPGVDWIIYIKDGGLKYDFIVRPGADPSKIKMKYEHQEDLKLNEDGSFTLGSIMGEITEKKPVSNQGNRIIATSFKLDGNFVGFDINDYDKTQQLTIDPAVFWATYYGGTSSESGQACATDALGNVYLAGSASSLLNIAATGHQNSYGGNGDAFLAKFDINGVRLWATYYGGNGGDVGYCCTTDNLGNVYLGGTTNSTINIAFGGHQNSYGGGIRDAFLVKFNSNGTRLWATYYGGNNTVLSDIGFSCVTDGNSNVYLAGRTAAVNNIATGGHQNTFSGNPSTDAFLVKFNTSGVRLWGTYYGGIGGGTEGSSCATDFAGNVYLVGFSNSTVSIASFGHQNTFGGGVNDAFVVKFNAAGVRLWASYYGGTDTDQANACATDLNGNVYIAGTTRSTASISAGGFLNIYGGGFSDAFLVKFNPLGTRLWASYYGDVGDDRGHGCATDGIGNVYICGSTSSPNNIAFGGVQNTLGGTRDAFLAKFNSAGTRLWATYYGDVGLDDGYACDIDAFGAVYLAGGTSSLINMTLNGHQNNYGGGNLDAFLVKFCDGLPQPAAIFGNQNLCAPSTESYSVSPVAGATGYTWTLPSGWAGSSVSSIITVTTGASGVLSVAATNSCGASPIQTLNVTTNPKPTVTINSGSICAGESFTIFPAGASSYTITGNDYTVSPTTTTSYSVIGVSAAGCLSTNTAVATITVHALPPLSVSDMSVCLGSVGTLTVQGASTYTWQPGNFLGNAVSITPTLSSTYAVIGTSSAGCIDSAAVIVSVLPVPTISLTTFSITCASLGSGTVSAVGGIGPYNYTWTPSGQTSPIINNLTPGSYTVSVHDAGTGCTVDSTTVFTSLIPLTGILENTDSLICPGATNGTATVHSLAGGSGNQNYSWTNGTVTYTDVIPTSLSAGSWTAIVTDALTGCQVYSVFPILQPQEFTLTLAANSSTACELGDIVLTSTNAGGAGGYTYTWTNGPPLNTYTVSETSGGTYVYTLNSTDANGCISSDSIAVNFISAPTLILANDSICPLEFGTLTASGATSYTWSNNSNANSIIDNPVVATQYTVLGSALGCTNSATASIIIKPVPTVIIASNSPRCENTSVLLYGSGGTTYNWSGPLGYTSSQQNPVVGSVALNQAGAYNLTLTAANTCTASASTTVVINPIPTVAATGATVCTSQTLYLTANSIPGAGFLWSGPIGFSSTQQNPSISNPNINRSGVYYVRGTSVQGCTNIATATVNVIPPPSLTVALSSSSLCFQALNGSPNTITLTSGGANTYTIFTPDLTGNGNPAGPSTTVSTMPPYSSTLVLGTATIVGSNGVCTNSVTRNYSVIPNPTVVITPTPVICAGQNYTYTSFGASTYVWTSSTPNFTTFNNGGVAVAHPSINSVFSVFGTSLGCNSASRTSTINVVPLPVINLTPQQPTICLHEKTTLTVNGTGTSFEWFPAEGLNNTVGMSVIASPLQTKNYTVVASANNCTNAANITVTVLALPQPTIINSKEKLCADENINLKGEGGVNFDWFGPQNIFYQGQEINFRAASIQFSGDFTLTVTDENGCKGNAVTPIVIQALPQGYLGGYKESVCVPYCGDFNFSGVLLDSELTSTWQIGNQVISNNVFSHCFSEAGTYTIAGKIIDAKTTCSSTVSYQIKVKSKPQADFYFSPLKPIEGIDEVIFTNASIGDDQNKWNWFFLPSPQAGNDEYKNKFQSENISYKFDNSGLYTIAMVVTNKWNCADTAIRTIQVEADFGMYIPNAFTPNNDGLNDEFKPVIRSASKYNLTIFDRWGHLIFESSDIENGWDGTNRGGVNSKGGVFAWKIEVTSLDGESKSLSGHVTLLR